jgi:hypothetical protein
LTNPANAELQNLARGDRQTLDVIARSSRKAIQSLSWANRAARHCLAFPNQLSPDLSGAMDAEALAEDAPDFFARSRSV